MNIRCLFIIIFVQSSFANAITTETERTFWVPWTLEYTALWEEYECSDLSPAHFRRNDYFEDIPTLLQRDTHWQTFCSLLAEYTKTSPIFPALGFAIIDKETRELLGIVRLKLSTRAKYLSLGYGLKPSARHQKLGSEIAAHVIKLINMHYQTPISTLKETVTKDMFMESWYEQGKQEKPDFNMLLNFFDENPAPLEGLTAFVNIINQPSLNILYNHGMDAVEVECSKYYLKQEPHLFSFSVLLLYPTNKPTNKVIDLLVHDLLSRDMIRIEQTESILKHNFHIPAHWNYLKLNREEKAQLKLVYAKVIEVESLDDISMLPKTIHTYESPYCFVK